MIFNAEYARKLTEEATSIDGPVAQAETQACLAEIKKAAMAGQRSCYVNAPFNHRALIVRRLEAAGFKVVVTSDQRDGDSTTVSW